MAFHYGAVSLDDHLVAQDQLLRGVRELEARQNEPFPASKAAFVAAVKDAHHTLFRHVLPTMAGRFRQEGEDVAFGGEGNNKREGLPHDQIESGVRDAFFRAQLNGRDLETRVAAFLALFFRVHPFTDGNGRIGRFFVQKICRASGMTIPRWNTTGRSRRRYTSALEYAHRHHASQPDEGVRFLRRWIAAQVEPLAEDDELDGL